MDISFNVSVLKSLWDSRHVAVALNLNWLQVALIGPERLQDDHRLILVAKMSQMQWT